MIVESDFLQVYDFHIRTASPLFVGDGGTILKKNYLFDSRSGRVTVFDEKKFFTLLIQRNLIDKYEQFAMGQMNNLYQFLTDVCRLTERDWAPAVRYCVSAEGALDREHSLKDIHTFIRDAYGRAYLPGSSVKGTIRTALLSELIQKDSGMREYDSRKFDRILEEKYLHSLKLKIRKPADAVNSIMRGIQLSDSLPIEDRSMMLALKKDAHVDGSFAGGRGVVCRESICPGTDIHLKLTLDQSVLKGKITKESLMEAIDHYDAYYADTYLPRFDEPEGAGPYHYDNSLIMGGGSGFFAKSLVYPYLGYEKGLQVTAEMMQRSFRRHHHDRDEALGISPHTMEYTKYKGEYYPMGLCEVSIT